MQPPGPTRQLAADLFLSYNHRDREHVDTVRQQLELRGVRTFIDHSGLTAGLPWPRALEQALNSTRAVAVFLGPHGLGGWQRREIFFALDLQVAAEKCGAMFPVVPVLLEGADPSPSFLLLNSWIDLRRAMDDGIEALVHCLSGAAHRLAFTSTLDPALLRPYVGLRAFREEDSGFFFGRKQFVEQLVQKVKHRPFVTIVGPSGSGKSSLTIAGLVPALRRQRPPLPTWEVATFTPGRHPWRRLADALIPLLEPELSEASRIALGGALEKDLMNGPSAVLATVEGALRASGGADRLLLVVDQLEELFTLTAAADRSGFLDALLESVQGGPLSIVATLRADFYGRALESSRCMSDALGQAAVSLGPLVRTELSEIIEGPIRRVGGHFEEGLVETIADEVVRQPSQLPLLEYALTELWNICVSQTPAGTPVELTLEAYRRAGALSGAITQRAEALFASLNKVEQRAARALFGRLVRVSRGGQEGADTRRRARRSEVGEDGWAIAQRFAEKDYRLLVVAAGTQIEDPTIEVAHETIIHHWSRLGQWVEEDRAALFVSQQVAEAVAEWQVHERNDEYLLEGPRLTAAHEWAAQYWSDLARGEREFLVRSFVREGLKLDQWIPRYAAEADAVALATEYLASRSPASMRRGLDVLRWMPESDGGATTAIVGIVLHDHSAGITRYAVETLCARRAENALASLLETTQSRDTRRRIVKALGHARNVRDVGQRALEGLGRSARRLVILAAITDILSTYSAAFALTFALSSLFGELALEFGGALARDVLALLPGGDEIRLGSSYREFSLLLTLAAGLFSLLRAIIDRKGLSPWQVFRVGVVAGAVGDVVQVVSRLALESVRAVFAALGGSGRAHPANFMFALTDPLDVVIAMGIVGFAVVPLASQATGKTFSRRFVGWAAAASATAVVSNRLLMPALFDLAGLNFTFGPLGKLAIECVTSVLLGTLGTVAAFVGFRLGLRIAFDDRPFPEWPVPELPPLDQRPS